MGRLFLVATPIGNMEDISLRARATLASVDLILAEDTRVSRRLLDHLGARAPLRSFHDHNKERITPRIVEELKGDLRAALITDAGTPGIADPAFFLTRAAIREGVPVTPIPGASAFICALVASGLPTDRFIFENFLPAKSSRRRKILVELAGQERTAVFYESPHRILRTLGDMDETLGDTLIVIARELTKLHEEFLRGSARLLLQHFEEKAPRGEMVIMFNSRIKSETVK